MPPHAIAAPIFSRSWAAQKCGIQLMMAYSVNNLFLNKSSKVRVSFKEDELTVTDDQVTDSFRVRLVSYFYGRKHITYTQLAKIPYYNEDEQFEYTLGWICKIQRQARNIILYAPKI